MYEVSEHMNWDKNKSQYSLHTTDVLGTTTSTYEISFIPELDFLTNFHFTGDNSGTKENMPSAKQLPLSNNSNQPFLFQGKKTYRNHILPTLSLDHNH